MTTTRRSLFGFLAGAPVAVATAKEKQPEPEFYVGQIRAVHSHYETRIVPRTVSWSADSRTGAYGGSYSTMIPTTESMAVMRHEQWNGNEWVPIDKPKEEEGA